MMVKSQRAEDGKGEDKGDQRGRGEMKEELLLKEIRKSLWGSPVS